MSLTPNRLSLVLAALVVGAPTLGQADTEPLQVASIDTITILGKAESLNEITGSAHSLAREELERHSFADPGPVLRSIPGVHAVDEEGLGQFPHISMRGVRPERNGRITVMEDGVLVGAPAPYSAPAAYYFPAIGRMEGIEVRKGSSAVKYGPYTVGGAINLISTQIPEEVAGQVHIRRGERNSQRSHAHVGGSGEQLGWLIENYSEQTDGFKELDYPVSGRLASKPNNPVPETGMDRNTNLAKLRWRSPEGAALAQEVEFKYSEDTRRVYDSYLGILAEDFDENPSRRYAGSQLDEINTENELFQLRHTLEFTDNASLATTIYRSETSRNWYKLHEVDNGDGRFVGITQILQNPETHSQAMAWILGNSDEFDAGRFSQDSETVGNVRANNRTYVAQGVQMQLAHDFSSLGWDHSLELGARYHEDEEDRFQWQDSYRMENGTMALVAHGTPGLTTNRLTEAQALALHAQNVMSRGPWTLVAGVRYEDIEQTRQDWDGAERNEQTLGSGRPRTHQYDVVIPGVGMTYRLGEDWSLLAGFHKGFSPAGANPDSEPEDANNFESGFRYDNDIAAAQVVGFYNDYSNINIECTNVGGGCLEEDIGATKSAGEVLIYGLEASWQYDLGAAREWALSVPVALGYTWTYSEFQQDIGRDAPNQWENAREGDAIPELPEHQLNVSAGLAGKRWQLNLNANYVTEAQAFADPVLEDLVIERRLLLDLAGEFQLNEYASLTASAENLTDKTYIAHHRPAGLRPGAPRSVWAGVKVRF